MCRGRNGLAKYRAFVFALLFLSFVELGVAGAQSNTEEIPASAYRYGQVDAASGFSLGIAVQHLLVSGSQISVSASLRNGQATKSPTFHLGPLKIAITDSSGHSATFKRGLMSILTTAGGPTNLEPGQSYTELAPLIAGPAGTYTFVASEAIFNENRSAVIGTVTSAALPVTIAAAGS